jgi:RNA polymerase sigma-70 factor, ECF subfamily
VRPWLYTILHNLLVDQSRRRKKRPRLVSIDITDEGSMSIAPEQEARLLAADLMRAIDALPDEQRAVLLLISVEDLSYRGAASILEAPIGTVMSRLARGRDRLATLMEAGERSQMRRRTS